MIDKKILVEFLRLKWNETKPFFIIIPSVIVINFGFIFLLVNKELLIVKIIVNTLVTLWLCVVSYTLFLAIKELIKWLKSNWKQATLNVYPTKRRKK